METQKINWFLIGAALSANLLSFGTGSAYAWTSPVLPKLNNNGASNPFGRSITSLEQSWIASLVSLGAAIGPFTAGYSADKIGRKPTLLLFALPMIVSYFITAFATVIELYYVARILIGLGSGCTFSIVPMYIGEIAEDSNRGLLGCLMGVMLSLAIFLTYVVGPYVSIKALSLLCVTPLIIFLIIFGLYFPESPYFYVLKNRQKEAAGSLEKLRNGQNANATQKELEAIIKNVQESKSSTFLGLFKSRCLMKGLTISIGLMFFQQFAGISVILGYMQTIFNAAESSISPEISSIIIGCIQLVITLLTSQLVDKLGRRILLFVSIIGVTASTGLLGTYFYFNDNGYDITSLFWLPVACLIGFVVFYNFGLGPLAWAMMGEIFPPNARAVASTITTFACLMIGFLTTVFFPNFISAFGMATSFWLFSVVSAVGILFVAWMVPETKGKSLQDIQNLLSGRKKNYSS